MRIAVAVRRNRAELALDAVMPCGSCDRSGVSFLRVAHAQRGKDRDKARTADSVMMRRACREDRLSLRAHDEPKREGRRTWRFAGDEAVKTSLVAMAICQCARTSSKMMPGHGRDAAAMTQMLKRATGERSIERISATVMTGQMGRTWSMKWSRTAQRYRVRLRTRWGGGESAGRTGVDEIAREARLGRGWTRPVRPLHLLVSDPHPPLHDPRVARRVELGEQLSDLKLICERRRITSERQDGGLRETADPTHRQREQGMS